MEEKRDMMSAFAFCGFAAACGARKSRSNMVEEGAAAAEAATGSAGAVGAAVGGGVGSSEPKRSTIGEAAAVGTGLAWVRDSRGWVLGNEAGAAGSALAVGVGRIDSGAAFCMVRPWPDTLAAAHRDRTAVL